MTPDIKFAIKAVNESATAFREAREEVLKTGEAIKGVSTAGLQTRAVFSGVIGGLAALAGTELLMEAPRAIKEMVHSVAELGETAEKIGLPVEKLQELQYAAERSGGSVEELDAGLTKFGINLGKAAAGG